MGTLFPEEEGLPNSQGPPSTDSGGETSDVSKGAAGASPRPEYGDLVKLFVDLYRDANAAEPPRAMRARMGKEAGVLIKERVAPDAIRLAVQLVVVKGLDPSALPSCVMTAHAQLREGITLEDKQAVDGFLREIRDRHGALWPTGSRWIRSTAAGTFVEDPLGVDRPTHDVPWSKPSRKQIADALKRRSARDADRAAAETDRAGGSAGAEGQDVGGQDDG